MDISVTSSQSTVSYATAYPEFTPGMTILQIDHGQARLQSVSVPDGSFLLEKVFAKTPSDFTGLNGNTIYTTIHKKIASIYTRYIKRIMRGRPVCLMSITVPDALTQSLEPLILRYGESWQKLVYQSRRGSNLNRELASVGPKRLIIGPICGNDIKLCNLK